MNARRVNQADYMSLQLMEIEQLRVNLSHQSNDKITFNEAAMLWFSQGCADVFRKRFQREDKAGIVLA